MNKTQLDISIQSADKYLTSEKRIEELLTANVQIEHKTDGVKLTVVKCNNNGNIDDYIFSYKGNVLYQSEYNYQAMTKIKSECIGASQFKAVFQHFKKLGVNTIPVGTELFIEFLMRKPTLSSNYTRKHKMVLIGYAMCEYSSQYGKLKTQPNDMQTETRVTYAKMLGVDTPLILFDGVLGGALTFQKGIKYSKLQKVFFDSKHSMNWDFPNFLLDEIKELFLSTESKYGGLEEGVVIKYNGRLLKWQQNYQLDQSARLKIKQQYREPSFVNETVYWEHVKATSFELATGIVVNSRKLDDVLAELSNDLKSLKLPFLHTKKTTPMIKDDIQLNTKMLLIKKMHGNNNALIIGKFRVLTTQGHVKLIKRAMKLYDNIVVCVVTSKDTKATKELRTEMLQAQFPKVQIMHAQNGNLVRLLQNAPLNINAVYAGTDRVKGYREQLKNTVGVSTKELTRTESDISASKVLLNINDHEYFKMRTPKAIHGYYWTLQSIENGLMDG